MQRLLIANRGEIARRIIRTARRMGIQTAAIYSDADTPSLHVREADFSLRLPGLTPRETYLDMERVIDAARRMGCDAVHPGYGFLSENHAFAERCAQAGITFVGPSAQAIELLGNKTNARRLAKQAGVPIMPGTDGSVSTAAQAASVAARIGYPVLLKAAAGGGGKGMRVVQDAEGLPEALRMAQGEALTAFGSDEVFVEKYLAGPRHIELQILADTHGGVVVLGERECSVQRRHQKVIEESPSPAVGQDLRQQMFAAAEKLVRAAGYTNAGTLEFLLDQNGEFYFLEVNTRLQVEHPVTEMVTGLDLVEQQLLIAMGEKLQITTETVRRSGHAVEARVCAEDVYDNFLPSLGTIQALIQPSGQGIRVDSGMYPGMQITPYYDPMLAKLIAWAPSRTEAIDKLLLALEGYHIAGISTTLPFIRFVMQNPQFRMGDYSTRFVSQYWNPVRPDPDPDIVQAAVAAAIAAHQKLTSVEYSTE